MFDENGDLVGPPPPLALYALLIRAPAFQPQPHIMLNYLTSAAVVRCLGAMRCAQRLVDVSGHQKLAADARAAAAASLSAWLQLPSPRQLVVG